MFPLHFPYRASPCAIRFQPISATAAAAAAAASGLVSKPSQPILTQGSH